MDEENRKHICSLCGLEFTGYGNNPQPVLPSVEMRCCNDCNETRVIPARIQRLVKLDKA